MSLTLVLFVAVMLTVIFHFLGVYAGAKKIVWTVLALLWIGAISFSMQEIKPKGYEYIKKMQGNFESTDALIKEAGDEISIYEMLTIQKDFLKHKKEKMQH